MLPIPLQLVDEWHLFMIPTRLGKITVLELSLMLAFLLDRRKGENSGSSAG